MARKIGKWGKSARYRRHNIARASQSSTYISYDFTPKDVISLIQTNKKFSDAVLDGKFFLWGSHIMLSCPETLRPDFGLVSDFKLFEVKKANYYLAKKVVVEPLHLGVKRLAAKALLRSELQVPAKAVVVTHDGGYDSKVIYYRKNNGADNKGSFNTYGTTSSRSATRTGNFPPLIDVVTKDPTKGKSYENIKGLNFPGYFNSVDEDVVSLWMSIFSQSDTRFNEDIVKYMDAKHITVEALAERARVSTRTISRMRNEEGYRCSLRSIVAVCLALQLRPWESLPLIQLMGYTLNTSHEEKVYRGLLQNCYKAEMDDINKVLIFWKVDPFEYKDRNSTK